MDEYFAVLKQYAVFSGRAGRREYWRFSPVQIGIAFCAGDVAGGGVSPRVGRQHSPARFERGGLPFYVMMLYALATIVPTCAVTVRRLHDTDHSGWWVFYLFNFLCRHIYPTDFA